MATRQPPGDPRLLARLPGEAGVAPVVPMPRAGLPAWALVAAALLAGLLLFAWLDARRREPPSAPAVGPRAADALGTPVPPPPLYIPPETAPPPRRCRRTCRRRRPGAAARAARRLCAAAVATPRRPPRRSRRRGRQRADLAVDTGAPPPAPAAAARVRRRAPVPSASSAARRRRLRGFAPRLRQSLDPVPQGTLISRCARDRARFDPGGFARDRLARRAGFATAPAPDPARQPADRRISVASLARPASRPGQLRLIRPDGVTMAIGSPASDTLGRAGIGAHVNTHFFERFAGAILQSALDVGVNLASAAGGGSVIVALPGIQGQAGQIIQPAQITPTLTVRQGTSSSIFVARDLDFTGAGNRR